MPEKRRSLQTIPQNYKSFLLFVAEWPIFLSQLEHSARGYKFPWSDLKSNWWYRLILLSECRDGIWENRNVPWSCASRPPQYFHGVLSVLMQGKKVIDRIGRDRWYLTLNSSTAAGWTIRVLPLICIGISVNNRQGTSWHNNILGVVKHAVMAVLSPDNLVYMLAPVADNSWIDSIQIAMVTWWPCVPFICRVAVCQFSSSVTTRPQGVQNRRNLAKSNSKITGVGGETLR